MAALWCPGISPWPVNSRRPQRWSNQSSSLALCSRESLPISSVAADALKSGQIRLYANCHVVSWDASVTELARMRAYLDANWSANLQEACREFCDLDGLLGKESFSAT